MTYLYFEHARGDTNSLKNIVHRGISHLPWSKQFIITSLSLLGIRSVPFEDLRSLHQVLEDRELRVHTDVEEQIHQTEASHNR